MTEAEARDLLAAWDGVGGLEAWMAAQPWQAEAGDWIVTASLQGWRFRVLLVPGGLRIVADAGQGAEPAEWTVKAR